MFDVIVDSSAGASNYPTRPSPVTLEEGVDTARKLEEVAKNCGFHVALTGGVLYRGSSRKDVDIVVYPHRKDGKHDKEAFLQALLAAGASNVFQTDPNHNDKDVVLITFNNLRIDLFFLRA